MQDPVKIEIAGSNPVPTAKPKPKHIRRNYLSRKNLARVKYLLKELDFVKLVYRGAVQLYNRRKTVFYDIDFYDQEGITWNVRQFGPCDEKIKMQEIVSILTQRVKIGTEITAE